MRSNGMACCMTVGLAIMTTRRPTTALPKPQDLGIAVSWRCLVPT